MADKFIARDLDFGGISKVKEAVMNPYANAAALPTGYGAESAGVLAYQEDQTKFVFWDGGAWVDLVGATVHPSEIDFLANPPIGTRIGDGTTVAGVTPTLATDIKMVFWEDALGHIHSYSRDGATFREVAAANQSFTEELGVKRVGDISAVPNKVTASPNGHVFLTTNDSEVVQIVTGNRFCTVVWEDTNLVADTPKIFDVNGGNGIACDLFHNFEDPITNTNTVSTTSANFLNPDYAIANVSVLIQTAPGEYQLDTESFTVSLVNGSGSQFRVESNRDIGDIRLVYSGHLKGLPSRP